MNPKVSVCLITYNHEKFISQALEGAIHQETDFEYEIVVGDDCSTDSTQSIVTEYKNKFPDKIKYHRHDKNIGMIGNWIQTIQSCKGEYIAIIEGDDYWTDCQKLFLQASLLDKHPEYSMCFHKVGFITDNQGDNPDIYLNQYLQRSTYTISDVITQKWFIGSCSMMVRNEYWKTFPKKVYALKAIDVLIQLMAGAHGDIGYIDKEMGIYRIHSQGISQQQWLGKENTFEYTIIDLQKTFDQFSNFKYHGLIKQRHEKSFETLLYYRDYFFSKHYLKALWRLMKLNPVKALCIVRDYIIVYYIPKWMYKSYNRIKNRISSHP